MPVAFASDAIREFSLTLDEIESNLEFLRLSAVLRPRLNGMLLWDSIQGDARRLVTDFLNQKSVELGPQFRGMIIVICGAFEHFVRRVVREAVIKLNAGANSFDNLHGELQRQNVYRTGRALTTIMQPLDHVTVDYSALAGNLATCVSGATTFTLNADAFTLFFTGGKPEHLADILKSIGLTLDWDDFGRISSFEGL